MAVIARAASRARARIVSGARAAHDTGICPPRYEGSRSDAGGQTLTYCEDDVAHGNLGPEDECPRRLLPMEVTNSEE